MSESFQEKVDLTNGSKFSDPSKAETLSRVIPGKLKPDNREPEKESAATEVMQECDLPPTNPPSANSPDTSPTRKRASPDSDHCEVVLQDVKKRAVMDISPSHPAFDGERGPCNASLPTSKVCTTISGPPLPPNCPTPHDEPAGPNHPPLANDSPTTFASDSSQTERNSSTETSSPSSGGENANSVKDNESVMSSAASGSTSDVTLSAMSEESIQHRPDEGFIVPPGPVAVTGVGFVKPGMKIPNSWPIKKANPAKEDKPKRIWVRYQIPEPDLSLYSKDTRITWESSQSNNKYSGWLVTIPHGSVVKTKKFPVKQEALTAERYNDAVLCLSKWDKNMAQELEYRCEETRLQLPFPVDYFIDPEILQREERDPVFPLHLTQMRDLLEQQIAVEEHRMDTEANVLGSLGLSPMQEHPHVLRMSDLELTGIIPPPRDPRIIDMEALALPENLSWEDGMGQDTSDELLRESQRLLFLGGSQNMTG